MPLKIAILGAGSITFGRQLMRDLLAVPEFADTTFALMDISKLNLDMAVQLCERDIAFNKLAAKIISTTKQREAITDADYVICLIRHGGLEAFQLDVDIPLKYGVDQCVGDTICAGGIMYAQRHIPVLLEICKDIREVAHPDALLLNYSNPMAMNTWACNQYGGVRVLGLCHGVQAAHWQIASCAEMWAKEQGLIGPDEKIHRKEVDVIASGLNHQTWFVKANWKGHNLLPLLPDLFSRHSEYKVTEKVRVDVLKRFGYYSTESNGHLSEYLPWYRKRPDEIMQWIDLSDWINDETGGYLRYCTEGRNWFETDFPQWLAETPRVIDSSSRSEEHCSFIIEALETGRTYRGHFNVVNYGCIPNLPADCIVEIPGYVDRTGIHMPVVGDLPLGCAATCNATVSVQRMGVEAAVHGDVNMLKLAILHDPLVGAVCNPEEVWQMVDEMLVAEAQWLPQYAAEIPAAQARLTAAEANGTRVKLNTGYQGAARLHTKTVEEIAVAKGR